MMQCDLPGLLPPLSRVRGKYTSKFHLISTAKSIMPPEADVEAQGPYNMLLPRLQSALRQFQASGRAFQLLDTSPPAPAAAAARAPQRCKTLVILDSSFNPPTLAHMQMALSALRDLRTQKDIAAALKGGAAEGRAAARGRGLGGGGDDDAVRLLLLLAVNNADKAPKPAPFEQRLLMMRYFAGDIQRAWRAAEAEAQTPALVETRASQEQERAAELGQEDDLPVDIGLTTHPYFHDKSAAIASSSDYDFSSSSPAEPAATEQIFLAGYDTLIRIFNPKYYSAPVPEAGVGSSDKTPMQASLDPFLERVRLRITMRTDADWGGREEQMRYVEGLLNGNELESVGGRREWAKRVEMVEAMEAEEGLVVSSTEARAAVKDGDWQKLRRLVPEDVAGCIEKGDISWEEGS